MGGGERGDGDDGHGHRRRLWLVVAAGAAVLLVVPLLAYAIIRSGGDDQPAGPGPGHPALTGPAAPSATPAPTGQSAPVPDGRIPMSVLRNATIFIPAWPSDAWVSGPSGWVSFTDGRTEAPANGAPLRLAAVAYGDVDRDGAQETVVNVHAGYEGGSWQLLALDRTPKGQIRTMGRVVATTGQVRMIGDDFAVTPVGLVQVKLADFVICCGEDRTVPQWQTRMYAWRSGRFVQVAGPGTFPPNPRVTGLSVSAPTLVLGPPVAGVRHGSLRVTVTVRKPVAPHHVALTFQLPDDLLREGDGWTGERVERMDNGTVWVHLDNMPSPALGTSRTYAFNLGRAADASGGDLLGIVVEGRTATNANVADENPEDNVATIQIRTAG
jgi:hypothetical protein